MPREQLYHRGRLARALAYLHGSGTVAGLKVVWERESENTETQPGREERLVVEPGLAIDRLGRLIELPRPACIRLNRWFEAQTDSDLGQAFHAPSSPVMISRDFEPDQRSEHDNEGPEHDNEDPEHDNEGPIQLGNGVSGVVVDVFLSFVLCERGKTPAFATGPFDALDAVVPSRLRDGYKLTLVLRQEATEGQEATEDQERIEGLIDKLPVNDRFKGSNPTEVQRKILAAWQEGSQDWDDQGRLEPLSEHALNQDPTALFLARLLLPATKETGGRPQRIMTEDVDVIVDNYSRAFSYPSGAIARLIELSS